MLKLLINLDESTDRLEKVTKALQTAGITDVKRVSGVNGNRLDDNYIESITTRYNDFETRVKCTRELSKGEVGCFLSHKKCWQMLLDSEEDYAIILEDDIVISERASSYLNNLSWLPRGVDICQLSSVWAHKKIKISPHIIKLENGTSDTLVEPLTHRYGAQCYLISRRAALYALEHTRTLVAPMDDYLFGLLHPIAQTFRIYRLMPTVVCEDHNGLQSIIGDRRKLGRMAPFYIRHGFTHFMLKRKLKKVANSGIDFECVFS